MALQLALAQAGLEPVPSGLALSVPAVHETQLRAELSRISASPPPHPLVLAALVEEKASERYDRFPDEDLLGRAYGSERIDAEAPPALTAELLSPWHSVPEASSRAVAARRPPGMGGR